MTEIAPSQKIFEALSKIPLAQEILSALEVETELDVAVFGGTIRDILFSHEPGRDLDILVFGERQNAFRSGVDRVAKKLALRLIDYPGSHLVLVPSLGGATFDVHYPKKTFLEGLVRSDFTVNGMGFRWKTKQLDDPFFGRKHLAEKKLVMHSPQYVVTNPANFPRMFRTAAKLGFTIEGETEAIVRHCAGMIALHDGKTNTRILIEFLKFLSVPQIARPLRQMNQLRLIEGIFPELTILSSVRSSDSHTILERNIELSAMFDSFNAAPELRNFLTKDVGLGITNLGFIRLMALFIDFGAAYSGFKPDAPYLKAIAEGDLSKFARRMELNLLMHIASRFKEARDFSALFNELPAVLGYLPEALKSTIEVPMPESISSPTKAWTLVLVQALRSVSR